MARTGTMQEGYVGDDGERRHDPEAIRSVADRFEGIADKLDSLDESRPGYVNAGVFTPYVNEDLDTVVADIAGFVLQLRAAADHLRDTAQEYESGNEENEHQVQSHLDIYEGEWSE